MSFDAGAELRRDGEVDVTAILADLRENLPQLRGILKELPTVLRNLAAFLEKAAKDDRTPDT